MNLLQTFSAPLGRILIASIFVMAGIQKIFAYAGTQGYMQSMGVPGELLPLVILLELLGGMAIVIGWKTKWVALALAGFTIIAAVIFHSNFADQMQSIMFMKDLAIAGGFVLLVAHGPGAYALDNARRA